MEIKTKDFGVIEIRDDILEFPTMFTCLKCEEICAAQYRQSDLMQLQSVEMRLRFIIIGPIFLLKIIILYSG